MNLQDWKSTPTDAPEGSEGQYDPPPAYSSHLSRGDPRSSSTQSLVPSLPNYDEASKRRLLVVYIHGFMGTDHSFQSFPAHVHRYLRDALIDTHVVHSKIYPRYKTYKAIEVARDNFSRWLQPHESPTTDVVLVGHSMGGLLAADVALMVGSSFAACKRPSLLTGPTAIIGPEQPRLLSK
ncbi:catalytic protein [Apiospora marii]|uniref:Catalytic protein n=1 Tax=Apiospora marii TaxID=335849 RepID=A0ABR1RIP4_9PEZI